jgi:hypothetical protein
MMVASRIKDLRTAYFEDREALRKEYFRSRRTEDREELIADKMIRCFKAERHQDSKTGRLRHKASQIITINTRYQNLKTDLEKRRPEHTNT